MGFAELALHTYARSGRRSPLKSPETTFSGLHPTLMVDVWNVLGAGWPNKAVPMASGATQKRNRFKRESFDFMRFPSMPQSASPNQSEEHTSELQSLRHLVCRLLLEK